MMTDAVVASYEAAWTYMAQMTMDIGHLQGMDKEGVETEV
jgi:hypothetical protein